MASAVRVVLCTVPDAEVGAALARSVVSEGLAACVNMLPGVRSFYAWEGDVHDDAELLLVAKTTEARLPALQTRLLELHPYDVPEVIALSVEAGAGAYLTWVEQATT